mmetsp:Transcript_100419/g.282186  ORF Transcript_100419/g.282186 Transcript_100419/m.282186 type:complete len:113 (+) Transcript_100419:895-1233(+)
MCAQDVGVLGNASGEPAGARSEPAPERRPPEDRPKFGRQCLGSERLRGVAPGRRGGGVAAELGAGEQWMKVLRMCTLKDISSSTEAILLSPDTCDSLHPLPLPVLVLAHILT